MDSISYLINFIFSFIHVVSISIYSQPELDFVKKYEIAKVKISSFEKKTEIEAIRIGDPISVQFHAYGNDFRIFLRQDHSVFSPYTKVIIDGNSNASMHMKNIPEAFIYEGIVDGFQQSIVNGHFDESAFVGKIDLKDEVYYLEMASKYIDREDYKDKVIVYRQSDIYLTESDVEDEIIFSPIKSIENTWKTFPDKLKTENKLTCEIALLADHTFLRSNRGNKAKAIAEMLYHVKIMDKVFSNIDLDNDTIPDGIGFSVEEITVIENKTDPNYPLKKQFSEVKFFLSAIANNYKQNWCMFIVFSHRNFNKTMGTAFVEAICDGSTTEGIPSYNVGYVTDISSGRKMPKFRLSYTLTHEMGHAFGSKHDEINNTICSPGKLNPKLGHYIMYNASIRNLSDGSRFNNWKFSPCSIKRIYETISNKGSCLLKNANSKCGNGITELGEECDCGPAKACRKLDRCCNPPGSPNECTLKRRSKNYCSPREANCCTERCRIVLKRKYQPCFVYNPCSNNTATCDGKSPFCPEIPLPDETPCIGPSFSCYFGHCIRNVCKENGLTPCKCPSRKECHICCLNVNGRCRTTQDLNLLQPNGDFYKLIPGTRCGRNKGICLKNGVCSSFEDKKPKPAVPPSKRRKGSNNWLYLLLIPFFLLLSVYPVYRVYRYYRNKNNMNKN